MVPAACAAALTVSLAAASSAGAHDCQCRYAGQKYDQGETVCMRGKIAECGMVLNNSSWKMAAEACPQVLAPQAPQRATSLAISLSTSLPTSLGASLASVAHRR